MKIVRENPDGMTLEEIGDVLGVTRERVRQIEVIALDKLKKGGSASKQWPASAVTDAVEKALTASRPKARYRVTVPTHAMAIARRLLPTRALDWLLSKG